MTAEILEGDVETCPLSLERPGLCCIGGSTVIACPEPARYVVLFDDGRLVEHLRCVEHAVDARVSGGKALVAMKDYRPRPGYEP